MVPRVITFPCSLLSGALNIISFIISSVSSFHGYNVEGGSFDVGKASTNAVVSSSMLILFADIFLTQLLS